MPKRKRNKCDESDYDYLAKKLKRLEKKIKSGRERHRSSSTSCDNSSPRNQIECHTVATINENSSASNVGCSYWNDWPEPIELSDANSDSSNTPIVMLPRVRSAISALPACSGLELASPAPATVEPATAPMTAAPATPPQPPAVTVNSTGPQPAPTTAQASAATAHLPAAVAPPRAPAAPPTSEPVPTTPSLDSDLMAILGDDPTSVKEFGDDIQNDLAIRLNHVATSGLGKENRKELKDKYLIPNNCKMIKAPTLNPEIRASLIESQVKRDKGIENKQILNACALSSLSKAITLVLSSGDKNQELLKLLMDTARVLADIQHSDSILRRFFVLSTVKKDLKDQLEKTKIDDLLFGNNLAETLKSARTINKSGADIRFTAMPRANMPKTNNKTSNKTLNYRAPPASRKPAAAGGARAQRPAPPAPTQRLTTTQQHNYRTSSRQQQPRHKR